MTTGLAPKSHGSHVSRYGRKTRSINPIHVHSHELSGNQPTKNESLFSKDVVTRLFKGRTAAFSQSPVPLIRSELFGIERLEDRQSGSCPCRDAPSGGRRRATSRPL